MKAERVFGAAAKFDGPFENDVATNVFGCAPKVGTTASDDAQAAYVSSRWAGAA